jgi:hypothetical protein
MENSRILRDQKPEGKNKRINSKEAVQASGNRQQATGNRQQATGKAHEERIPSRSKA